MTGKIGKLGNPSLASLTPNIHDAAVKKITQQHDELIKSNTTKQARNDKGKGQNISKIPE